MLSILFSKLSKSAQLFLCLKRHCLHIVHCKIGVVSMKRNTWANVLMKVGVIFLFVYISHKNQWLVSSFDLTQLTPFQSLTFENVREPLHLASTSDPQSLMVQQIDKNRVPLENTKKEELFEAKKSIYIYNTHQYETYVGGSVLDGAKYLAQQLTAMGYEVIVEENDFEAYKRANNMDLTETYPTSRIFLEKQLASHGPFDLVIDFHRDAISKEASTTTVDGVNYVKMMMVVSLTADYASEVEANSALLHQAVEQEVAGIMRQDFKREYAYYNQHVTKHMVLIEIGGMENTFDEVQNTLNVLAKAIDKTLKEGKLQ